MPKVGGKHFPYSVKGKKAAEKAKDMMMSKKEMDKKHKKMKK